MKYISNLIFILFFISSIFSQNILSFEYTGGDSIKINLTNSINIAGYEIRINGIEILDLVDASSADYGINSSFSINTDGSLILGFSFNVSINDLL